jgi:hypothetical protein
VGKTNFADQLGQGNFQAAGRGGQTKIWARKLFPGANKNCFNCLVPYSSIGIVFSSAPSFLRFWGVFLETQSPWQKCLHVPIKKI